MSKSLLVAIAVTALCLAPLATVSAAPLPTALQFGDSVSRAYAMEARADLYGKVDYRHDPWSAGDVDPTKKGYRVTFVAGENNNGHSFSLIRGMRKRLEGQHYDVILFNTGLHDVQPYFRGHPVAPLPQYRKNLEKIAADAAQHARIVIWVDTTDVPADLDPSAQQYGAAPHAQVPYNQAAQAIAKEHGFYILNLTSDGRVPHDVHYTPEGAAQQGKEISDCVLLALAAKQSDICHK